MLNLLMLLLAALFTARGGDPDPDPDPEPAPGSDPDPEPSDPDPDDGPSGAGGGDNDLDAEALKKELEKVRREAANRRTQLRERESQMQTLEEQNKAILKALGIDDGEDDQNLSNEVERLASENKRLRLRQDFAAAAREAGADEDLTWGYLLARGEIDSLDPSDDDFDSTLQALVKTAVESKPGLKATTDDPPPPDKGGGDMGGGGDNGVRQLTRDELKSMSPEEIEEAREKGQLRSLMSNTG